jgi:hypothetical protein
MKIIPLQPVANQSVTVSLSDQVCQIDVYKTIGGIFLDLYVSNVLIIGGVVCESFNRIVREAYLGFVGDLAFMDTQGADDPEYTGLGSRWVLAYLLPSELQ